MPEILVNAPLSGGAFDIVRDADWRDEFQIMDGESAKDLNGCVVELWARPIYGHEELLKLCTTEDGTILITDAATGTCRFDVPSETIRDELPIGRWQHFLKLKEPDGILAPWFETELLRGDFNVHAGRVTGGSLPTIGYGQLDFEWPRHSGLLALMEDI